MCVIQCAIFKEVAREIAVVNAMLLVIAKGLVLVTAVVIVKVVHAIWLVLLKQHAFVM